MKDWDGSMRAWFIASWLVVFPVACGICTLSFTVRSPMSGGGKQGRPDSRPTHSVRLDHPELFLASVVLFAAIAFETRRQFAMRRRRSEPRKTQTSVMAAPPETTK